MNTTHVLNTRRAAPFQRDEPDELTTTVSTDARVPQGIKYCDTRRSIVVPGLLRNDNQPFHHFPRQNNSSDSENSSWPQEDIETLAQTLPEAPTETRTKTRVEPALQTRCPTNSSAANLGGTRPSARTTSQTTAGTWTKALTTREDRTKDRAGRGKSLARPMAGTMAKTRSKTMSKAVPKIHRDKQPPSPTKSSTTAMSILARINMSKAMAKIHRDKQSPSPPESVKTAMPISAPVMIPTPRRRLGALSTMEEAPSIRTCMSPLTALENPRLTGPVIFLRPGTGLYASSHSRTLAAHTGTTTTAAAATGLRL
ncbi:hypothetical protein MGU_06805 [Metarhizium guizhouense ARSEF 977]|uniref:Uncharacterized protein n=1 Tax=Metarhizium guizhouense (strain ARSEF 977) TaxID=1276136 RepID=A0A0B4GTZ5_METGA|nr:hypothetical protein MGU_06805 [Metarhizium guizhouense ARSEF 977]